MYFFIQLKIPPWCEIKSPMHQMQIYEKNRRCGKKWEIAMIFKNSEIFYFSHKKIFGEFELDSRILKNNLFFSV